MKDIKLKFWWSGVIIVCSIIIACLLTYYLGTEISLSMFAPNEKKGDFHITDIYNAVEVNNINANAGGLQFGNDVVVVAVDKLEGRNLLDVIDKVIQLQPTAIGLDLPFEETIEGRDFLMDTILSNNQIVSATYIDSMFTYQPICFYEGKLPHAHFGYINLNAADTWSVVRTFCPYVIKNNTNDTIPSMVLELAKLSKSQHARNLIERDNCSEVIDFVSCQIRVIPADSICTKDAKSWIKGKTVLIGDMNYAADIHMTPLHENMPGVLIHAYALQTVLASSYIDIFPEWIMWLITIVSSLLFLCLLQYARNHWKNTGNINIRLLQFLGVFGLVWLGCKIFSQRHMYVDFTPIIFIMGFCTLVFDILYGFIGIVRFCPRALCAIKRKYLYYKIKKKNK